jgi:hypothetical protein
MGHGNYSHEAHEALIADRKNLPQQAVFKQRTCHNLMNPRGLKVRECCDSADHPNSMAIVFALDVTGSMGEIPERLARKELPQFMKVLMGCGVADPQVLFMAVGDATSDSAPLQVGQFESSAELMDQWLTWSFLEGAGGGQNKESYELVFYTLAQHTLIDCYEKRKKKGYLFMTGDELPYPAVSRHQVQSLFEEKLDEDLSIEEVIAAAAETYHLFFLIPTADRRERCEARWRELLGDGVICMESAADSCEVAALAVALTEGKIASLDEGAKLLETLKVPKERIGSSVRALAAYAEVLKAGSSFAPPAAANTAGRPSWWTKLFG